MGKKKKHTTPPGWKMVFPKYDKNVDLHTNESYFYDFLGKWVEVWHQMGKKINRLFRRNIEVIDTNSIDLTKIGDWLQTEGDYCDYQDVISLQADVIISTSTESYSGIVTGTPRTITIPNGTVVKNNGVWSPDYKAVLDYLQSEINKALARITKNEQDIAALTIRVNNLEIRVEDHETRITVLENKVSVLEQWRITIDNWKNTIDTAITNIRNDITNIQNDIKNIYETIDGLETVLSGTFTTLRPGVDYETTFYNGFNTPSGNIGVQLIETNFSIVLRFYGNSTTGNALFLTCSNINAFQLRHTQSVVDVPESRLFAINFLGSYSRLNNLSPLGTATINTGSQVWNVNPASVRARWPVTCAVTRNSGGDPYVIAGTTIADGVNQQYSTAWPGLNDQTGALNISVEYTMTIDPT